MLSYELFYQLRKILGQICFAIMQGHKSLDDCLQDFTKKERLDGDNQYLCGTCNGKRDATRCVRLLELPPVLNLQLNRFVFDM